ncbi:hypothetical protein [Lactiplantibacillus daowaiensis]|uniref:Integral membrane protein n=1 Tax=Lactiplantibacillus daowaiensis TaxID=2559918 RepID=A0ABW1S2V6_9LACO|nr:hypothetical protein [Lactiplantibacillus daowaiensis]
MKTEARIRNALYIGVLLVMVISGFIPALHVNRLPGMIISVVAVFVLDYGRIGGKLNAYFVKQIKGRFSKK